MRASGRLHFRKPISCESTLVDQAASRSRLPTQQSYQILLYKRRFQPTLLAIHRAASIRAREKFPVCLLSRGCGVCVLLFVCDIGIVSIKIEIWYIEGLCYFQTRLEATEKMTTGNQPR